MKSSHTSLSRFTGILVAAVLSLAAFALPASAGQFGVTGTVTNESGSPIPGACLTVYRQYFYAMQEEQLGKYCADAQGIYSIPPIPTDPYYAIRAEAAGYRTKWLVRDRPTRLNADKIYLPNDYLATIDVQMGTGSGTLKGRVTDAAGNADLDTNVTVYRAEDTSWRAAALTFPGYSLDGKYEIPNLKPGDYKIQLNSHSRGSLDLPEVYTVANGGTVVANLQWPAPGAIQLTVTDLETGAPVSKPCAQITAIAGPITCGVNGVVTLQNVQAGDWSLNIWGAPSHFGVTDVTVTVANGQTTQVQQKLRAGSGMRTTVLNAQTGGPAESVCVHIVDPASGGQSAHMQMFCADKSGLLEIGPFEDTSRKVQLYAFQVRNPFSPPVYLHGDQWVALNGGTGDQRWAALISLKPKSVVTVPVIRMDPPGTITGTIRDGSTGAPVGGVCAYPYAFNAGQGGITGPNCSNSAGTYTIADLGPYRWPVEYVGGGNYAWQWSGDVTNRFAASMVKVTAGANAGKDANMARAGDIAGTVTGPMTGDTGSYVWSRSAVTGDMAAFGANISRTGGTGPGTFSQHVLANQNIYLQLWVGKDCWYGLGAAEIILPIRTEPGKTKNMTINTDTNCASPPTALPFIPKAPGAPGPAPLFGPLLETAPVRVPWKG
jgi:hypothetical protein